MQAKVIDISSWQHPTKEPINFEAVSKAGVAGVIIKATQGVSYLNPYFEADYQGALAAGLMVGAYHYASPKGTTAQDEAGAFIAAIANRELDLGVWLDWDDPEPLSGPTAATYIAEFFQAITGRSATEGLYIDANQIQRTNPDLSGLKLWAADTLPDHYPTPWMQQHPAALVSGISGPVSIDIVANIRGLNPASGGPVIGAQPGVGMPILRLGDKGQAVEVLQHELNHFGYALTVDGIFGALTLAAVKAAQTHAGIAEDGIVGPITWGMLIE